MNIKKINLYNAKIIFEKKDQIFIYVMIILKNAMNFKKNI